MKAARALVMFGIAGGFAAAILSHGEIEVMATGLSPIAWLALEGGWRLLDPFA